MSERVHQGLTDLAIAAVAAVVYLLTAPATATAVELINGLAALVVVVACLTGLWMISTGLLREHSRQ